MYQNTNYYPQQQMRTPIPQTIPYGLKGRPVSSLEEARASSIDFDGSVFYFPDLANRRIYTKQINMVGTATLNMYELKEIPVPTTSNIGNYVTREEFEEALNKLQDSLKSIEPSSMTNKKPQAQPEYLF